MKSTRLYWISMGAASVSEIKTTQRNTVEIIDVQGSRSVRKSAGHRNFDLVLSGPLPSEEYVSVHI